MLRSPLLLGRASLLWFAFFGVAILCVPKPLVGQSASAFTNQTVLVMVDDKGCVYCAKWDREISSSYSASDEGQFAPLARRIKGHPDLSGLAGLRFTPTFVLLERGHEVGRIIGYGGEDHFWGELDRLLSKSSFSRRPNVPKVPKLQETALPVGVVTVAVGGSRVLHPANSSVSTTTHIGDVGMMRR
jgi:hypothetical protein